MLINYFLSHFLQSDRDKVKRIQYIYAIIHNYANSDNGDTNVIGSGSYNIGNYFYELTQEMDSSDDIHDVSLVPGNQ